MVERVGESGIGGCGLAPTPATVAVLDHLPLQLELQQIQREPLGRSREALPELVASDGLAFEGVEDGARARRPARRVAGGR